MVAQAADTLSGRFAEQWAFVSTAQSRSSPESARSLPPSSYIPRSSQESSFSRNVLNASRSSLPRNLATASVGGRSTISIPSQPVLLRVHSADASNHSLPPSKIVMPKPIHTKKDELPPLDHYSIKGILAAIEEDIEEDVNAISEILGRSRFVLADQHESHLPPTGEIRALTSPLGAVEEATSSAERLAADEALIVAEDASLVEGSNMGSAAYGLLERLQVIPRMRRITTDIPSSSARPTIAPVRHNSSPAGNANVNERPAENAMPTPRLHMKNAHRPFTLAVRDGGALTTKATVSETLLSPMAVQSPVTSRPQANPEAYAIDADEVPLLPERPHLKSPKQSLTQRLQRLAFWLNEKKVDEDAVDVTAAKYLENVLKRHLELATTISQLHDIGAQHVDQQSQI